MVRRVGEDLVDGGQVLHHLVLGVLQPGHGVGVEGGRDAKVLLEDVEGVGEVVTSGALLALVVVDEVGSEKGK